MRGGSLLGGESKKRKWRLGLGGRLYLGIAIFLVLLLLSAGLSMYVLVGLSREMQELLVGNNRSVASCQGMLSALTQQQKDLEDFLLSQGAMAIHPLGAEASFRVAAGHFEDALQLASENHPEMPAHALIDSLEAAYGSYKSSVIEFLQQPARHEGDHDLASYLATISPMQQRIMGMVNRLLGEHQTSLQRARAVLTSSPERVLRPGLIIAAVGLIFAVLLSYMVHRFYLHPLRQITRCVDQYANFKRYSQVSIQLNGELLDLRKALDRLVYQLRARGGDSGRS